MKALGQLSKVCVKAGVKGRQLLPEEPGALPWCPGMTTLQCQGRELVYLFSVSPAGRCTYAASVRLPVRRTGHSGQSAQTLNLSKGTRE